MTAAPRFVTPDGADSVFPWDLTSSDPAGMWELARRYGLPTRETVTGTVHDFETRLGPDGPGCLHTAGPGPLVVGSVHVNRCASCTDALYAQVGDQWDVLDAAVSLAHWTAWLDVQPSPSAAAVLEGVVANVAAFGYASGGSPTPTLDPLDVEMIDVLLERALTALAHTPAAFDPAVWLTAFGMDAPLEDAHAWAFAVTSGATVEQARAYVTWLAPDHRLGPSLPAVTGELEEVEPVFVLWAPAKSTLATTEWTEPSLRQRLGVALRVPASQRAIRAMSGLGAAAMHAALESRLVDYTFSTATLEQLDPSPSEVSASVAAAAERMWSVATEDTCMASAWDCLEVAGALDGNARLLDTALALTPEWRTPGRELVKSVRALCA